MEQRSIDHSRIYYENGMQTEFDATVTACEQSEGGYAVRLDRTAFFPGGGGQEADTGEINGLRLISVFEKDGDYTIIAETNQNGNRELVIDLGAITNKPFKMLSFNISNGERPTEIMPELSPVTAENGIIKVKLEPAHTMYLFTTAE